MISEETESSLICLNVLTIRSEIWRSSLFSDIFMSNFHLLQETMVKHLLSVEEVFGINITYTKVTFKLKNADGSCYM